MCLLRRLKSYSIIVLGAELKSTEAIKCPENAHESKVEMVISAVPKPVFPSVFWTFYSASVIYVCVWPLDLAAGPVPAWQHDKFYRFYLP